MSTATVVQMSEAPQNASRNVSDSELETLSEQQLKADIESTWNKHAEHAKREMAPRLYWLRERLRAQGARNDIADQDHGFGAWVEGNLGITRRTADRWCDWWAIERGLKKSTNNKVKQPLDRKSKSSDGTVTLNVSFVVSEQEQDEFLQAMEILGEDAKRVIYEAVVNAARKRPSNDNQT